MNTLEADKNQGAESLLLVKRAGLELAWEMFPQEIVAAIASARQIAQGVPKPAGPNEEPWPPMQVQGTP